jgi:glycosyltransferase involved in cell wall biosynthesis
MVLIADELRGHGIDVALAALCRGRDAEARNVLCEILVDRDQLNPWDYLRAFLRLTSRIRANRPTAILSFMPGANILGTLSGAVMGVPIRVATHHEPASSHHPLVRRIDRLLGRLGTYSHVVAVTNSIRSSLKDYPQSYLKRVRVIRDTIRPITPSCDRLAVRRHFGLRGDTPLLVVMGSLSQEANLLNMLAGASRVAGIQLALVGDGPLRPKIERSIAEMHLDGKVFLLGRVEHQVAADILFAADVFVQLGAIEGPNLPLLEAVYAEKAIVAGDIASQREILTMKDGRVAGLICDPSDIGAIARALSTVATNKMMRRDLVRRTAALKNDLDSMRMGFDYASLLTGRTATRGRVAT